MDMERVPPNLTTCSLSCCRFGDGYTVVLHLQGLSSNRYTVAESFLSQFPGSVIKVSLKTKVSDKFLSDFAMSVEQAVLSNLCFFPVLVKVICIWKYLFWVTTAVFIIDIISRVTTVIVWVRYVYCFDVSSEMEFYNDRQLIHSVELITCPWLWRDEYFSWTTKICVFQVI